jgi:hypothetical protein
MKKKQIQPPPKPFTGWALYNWGIPLGVFTSRRQAIDSAQNSSGEPWRKCKGYFTVAKVEVRLPK